MEKRIIEFLDFSDGNWKRIPWLALKMGMIFRIWEPWGELVIIDGNVIQVAVSDGYIHNGIETVKLMSETTPHD